MRTLWYRGQLRTFFKNVVYCKKKYILKRIWEELNNSILFHLIRFLRLLVLPRTIIKSQPNKKFLFCTKEKIKLVFGSFCMRHFRLDVKTHEDGQKSIFILFLLYLKVRESSNFSPASIFFFQSSISFGFYNTPFPF